jgi:hypothetical protein
VGNGSSVHDFVGRDSTSLRTSRVTRFSAETYRFLHAVEGKTAQMEVRGRVKQMQPHGPGSIVSRRFFMRKSR